MTLGVFYKWEDHNHGLEHKCGTCATVLSSPRAKKTCFGVHEEVCPAYHKTLHFIGASHKCAACSHTTKAHNKRHLGIAEIIQAIHCLEGRSTTASKDNPLCNNKRKGKKKDDSHSDPSDDGSVPLSAVDSGGEAERDSNASTLNNDNDDTEEREQCCSGGIESLDARKAAKAERKAAKNQVLFDLVTQEDLAAIERALHPQSEKEASTFCKDQGLANNRTIDENIAFNANTFKWGELRQGVHAKKVAKINGKQKPNTPEQDNKILSPIFAQLGIDINVSKANRERKSLDAKLRAAILGDLVAFENDQVETMQRMAGYWRYANRRTFNEMVRNNELWDWATGEKLPEIREEAELDVIEEEAETVEPGSRTVEMEGRIPETWNDPDCKLPAGKAALSQGPLVSKSETKSGQDMKPDEEVESTRDGISMSKLPSSPERLPSQTLGFNVVSPLSSDETWERRRAESGDLAEDESETLGGSPATRSPLSSMTSNPKGPHEQAFQGVKDNRVFGKAIRKASPPSTDVPRQLSRSLSLPASPDRNERDPRNRFGALDREVPAPCEEEVKEADPTRVKAVIRIPAKPIVKTLVVHDEQDDWKTMHVRPRGKKGAKGSPTVALREHAAVNVRGKKFAGGKSFATVVKRGL